MVISSLLYYTPHRSCNITNRSREQGIRFLSLHFETLKYNFVYPWGPDSYFTRATSFRYLSNISLLEISEPTLHQISLQLIQNFLTSLFYNNCGMFPYDVTMCMIFITLPIVMVFLMVYSVMYNESRQCTMTAQRAGVVHQLVSCTSLIHHEKYHDNDFVTSWYIKTDVPLYTSVHHSHFVRWSIFPPKLVHFPAKMPVLAGKTDHMTFINQ